ncbi:NAD-dependent epimerase/dehydratase family protein [Phycicoccus endophyticus]|uniref:NAD-dependent epimerase/dehydratase family protein n=1 Tax=Phycicoccus endophyticus TaxID=1690220 RepID=A0A7G9R1D8_9MICO|nr:NAD-dependent epimerase/dehydratase family protein [Phycicoccus endophyticus]NHI18805.1 NAD-dependent epimerase/dehydratase family protein [Phycicoccus endophyticus]QNN49413.1 NAD-dependent epimerase/dehydratase family protein [Phycicoccus endophyticus]GGL36418.1 UDP-glucose 4-epimerase [Phycicoccus endophyticus]
MRVLLTGAAGFVGTATWRRLVTAGHDVVAVDLLLPEAHGPGTREHPPGGLHVLDTREAPAWGDLLQGVEVVVHLAAMVGAGASAADLPAYAGHNDLGTAAVLAAMHATGVRGVVQASSMVVYGEGRYSCPEHGAQAPGPRTREALDAGRFDTPCPVCAGPLDWELVDEEAPLDPRSAYAVSKVAQEGYAAAWARQSPGSAVSLRYHNVYGPGMPRDTPYSGVAAMFRSSLERGEPPTVYEDGRQMRDFVHVDDVARATVAAAEAVLTRPRATHTAYNVCSGHPVAVADVARHVAAGSSRQLHPRVTGQYRIGDVRHVVASPERARAELGFTARVTPQEGLAAFATAPLRP